MKRINILLVLLFVSVMSFNVWQNTKSKKLLSDLVLVNVEALAQGETASGTYKCYGSGDLDCAGTGIKVAYIFGPYDLD